MMPRVAGGFFGIDAASSVLIFGMKKAPTSGGYLHYLVLIELIPVNVQEPYNYAKHSRNSSIS